MPRRISDRPARRRGRIIGPPELLEGRALLATFTWASPTSGDFAVAANWDGPNGTHAVPGPKDDVVTPGGSYTITSSASETINSFNGGATLDVAAGTFTLENLFPPTNTTTSGTLSTVAALTVAAGATFDAEDDGPIVTPIADAPPTAWPVTPYGATSTAIDGGSIAGNLISNGHDPNYFGTAGLVVLAGATLDSGAVLSGTGQFGLTSGLTVAGSATVESTLAVDSGQSLDGPGPLLVSGTLALDGEPGGVRIGIGSIVVARSGVLDLGSISSTVSLDGTTVSNAGETDAQGTVAFSGGAAFDNEAGGTFLSEEVRLTGGTAGTFQNMGTFDVGNGSGTTVGVPFVNAGLVEVVAGNYLNVDGDYTQSASGTLEYGLSGPPLAYATLEISGQATLGGTLKITGGSYTPAVGLTFPVLSFASSAGNFASVVNATAAGPVVGFAPERTAASYGLLVTPGTPTAAALDPSEADVEPGVTTNARPMLTGHAAPGVLVQVYDADGNLIASATANQTSGAFTATPPVPLAPGNYILRAVEVGPGGVYGPAGPTSTLKVLSPAPTGLTLLPADDTGGAGVTAIHAPRVTGKATPGILVQIYEQTGTPDAKLVGSAVADPTGTFVARISPALGPGSYTLEAIAIAPNGFYGEAGSPYKLTISALPPAPTGLALVGSSGTTTSSTTPQLTGQSVYGLQIQVYDSGTLVAWADVESDGTFVTHPLKPLAVGVHALEAIAIDAGGNYGAAGAPFRLTVT